ncbi:MAG: serine/threonine-protein phosphatase, partial [Fretibacterium sp.]|nr:serine/threonine-protein phosphatase [Fretibacterium sp.]
PAAMFMMRGKTALRGLAESGDSPAEILYKANNALCEGNDAEMFITAWIGLMNLRTGRMKCANAGHEYPMLMRAGGSYRLMRDPHGPALAGFEGQRFEEYEIRLKPGDRLFVYTDGIPEAQDEQEEQYDNSRLLRGLNNLKDLPMKKVLPAVRQDIRSFVGTAGQFDDITMLGFELLR